MKAERSAIPLSLNGRKRGLLLAGVMGLSLLVGSMEDIDNSKEIGKGVRPNEAIYPVRVAFPTTQAEGTEQGSGYQMRDDLSFFPVQFDWIEPNERKNSPSTMPSVSESGDTGLQFRDNGMAIHFGQKPRAEPSFGESREIQRLRFAQAFREFAKRGDVNAVQAKQIKGLLVSKFRLEEIPVSSANSIEVRKSVHADGVNKGKVALHIVNETTILIDSGELAKLFAGSQGGQKLASIVSSSRQKVLIDFDTLRAAGFDVRYDPVRDVVVMSSHKS